MVAPVAAYLAVLTGLNVAGFYGVALLSAEKMHEARQGLLQRAPWLFRPAQDPRACTQTLHHDPEEHTATHAVEEEVQEWYRAQGIGPMHTGLLAPDPVTGAIRIADRRGHTGSPACPAPDRTQWEQIEVTDEEEEEGTLRNRPVSWDTSAQDLLGALADSDAEGLQQLQRLAHATSSAEQQAQLVQLAQLDGNAQKAEGATGQLACLARH